MKWFSLWARGIVVAVIVSTVVELLLPENSSKKFVKIVVGVFIVYTILSPVIQEFGGVDLEESLSLENFVETSAVVDSDSDSEASDCANDSVKRLYIQNLENDLKLKLKNQGYVAEFVNIKIADDDSYNITSVEIKVSEKVEVEQSQQEVQGIVETIKEIKVKLEGQNEDNDGIINDNDKNKIKEYVKNTYEIDINNVCVS